jgi:hypothetical protein
VLVINPVEIPQLVTDLAPIVNPPLGEAAQNNPPGKQDIFNKLPYETRQEIFKLLPAASVLALKAASWAMHTTAISRDLWKSKLRSEMPWVWEVHDIDLFLSQELEGSASKFLLLLEQKSRYTVGQDDCILGLANRRRIWSVCEQIRSRYLGKLDISNVNIRNG